MNENCTILSDSSFFRYSYLKCLRSRFIFSGVVNVSPYISIKYAVPNVPKLVAKSRHFIIANIETQDKNETVFTNKKRMVGNEFGVRSLSFSFSEMRNEN